MNKVADTISPDLKADLEHMQCCISGCCLRKHIYNFTKYLKQKTMSWTSGAGAQAAYTRKSNSFS